jgi:putative nucleotidyltransferase with HDIG domain
MITADQGLHMTHYIDYGFPYKPGGSGSYTKTTERLTGLSRLSHFLAGIDTIEGAIDRVSGIIQDLLHIDYCRIFTLQSNDRYLLHGENHEAGDSLDQLFHRVTASTEVQRPSSLDQVLDNQCRNALGLKIRDSHWIIPLAVEQSQVGMLVLAKRGSSEMEAFPKDTYYLVDLIADQLGNALHRKQLNARLVNSSLEIVLALSKTLETRDPYSGEHSKQLAFLSEQIAHHFHFSIRETRELCWAALLHDIGKIGIEDQILHKPGPLTNREWEVMKSHSEIGAHIVQGLSGLEKIASIILAHHERFDGTGYPHQLKGEQIPISARIIAVVDSYSAMTEGRVYRAPYTHEAAMVELVKYSGSMYDPDVVSAFITLFESGTISHG